MKVLVLTNDWPPIEGGISSLTVGLASELAHRGHLVTALAPAVDLDSVTTVAGVHVERWRGYGLGTLRLLPFVAQAARRLSACDVALAMNPAYGGPVAHLLAPPLGHICWAYGLELLNASRSRTGRRYYRAALGGARRIIAISRYTRRLLLELGVAADRIAVLPPGVTPPPQPAPPITSRPPNILTVGRLVRRKGHAVLLEAMPRVLASHPRATLLIAGRGPEATRLERRIAALGLGGRVRLLGHVNDAELDQLYRQARVFALTARATVSDAEGFGLVYLEAAARGVPAVAGRGGGVEEAVTHDETGLVVAPDDTQAIAAALDRLLGDDALATRLSHGARGRAAASTWDDMAARLEAILGGTDR